MRPSEGGYSKGGHVYKSNTYRRTEKKIQDDAPWWKHKHIGMMIMITYRCILIVTVIIHWCFHQADFPYDETCSILPSFPVSALTVPVSTLSLQMVFIWNIFNLSLVGFWVKKKKVLLFTFPQEHHFMYHEIGVASLHWH